ncbi:creatininase family protein [Mycobacterium intracellulare]|uniref:Creatinine amidohydrolase n=3 Tax=Mycobacterium avium complex (MAC) TaxID=120793 RepID=A0ABM7JAQ7_9MYCO|nr:MULTISPECIES: creatininase family protein [Mycobacterium]AFJ37328.1 amidase [Mycobacterium sp. MOTT36Y]MCV7407523.1 creatininase family protein [Mycobacterium marseillense]MDO2360593.1 creatininase family protein [Mycobacterium avium subsp. hominissuis]ORA91726.1 creatinine amidohydrolase [Mycobacterium marseillense]UBV03658.1 creatininase family protein [Mycobacterium avium subsp. hominissuis]
MSRRVIPDTTTADSATASTVAVLPVGAFEQHGPYLPLGTDTLIACAIASSISQHHNVFQLPPVAFGCSHEHAAYPGTVSISATTLAAVVADITESLAHQNIAAFIVVNGHGGNAVLTNVVQQANHPRTPMKVGLYPSRDDWAEARIAAGIQSSNHDDMHAGELETSILLASCPDYLREGWQTSDHTASDRRYLTTLGIHAYTPTGIIGYPSHATETKGNKALDHLGRNAATLIEVLTGQ